MKTTTNWRQALTAAAYRGLEAADRVAVAVHNLRHADDMPLPPMRLRARIGSRGAADFLRAGRSSANALRAAARDHLDIEIGEGLAVLDFGCGCGRTLRHFTSTTIHGCDVDAEAIAWMQRSVAFERFAANRFEPPLPWFEATFDLVYSVSVFTHVTESAQRAWLQELARVLKPGGAALLTVQTGHALSMFVNGAVSTTQSMRDRLALRGSLDAHPGFIFEPYEIDVAKAYPGVTNEYGLTFHHPEYIRRVWGDVFEVRGIDVGSVDGLQDVVALRKP